jgi:endonuclease/exonuclease/phosphatase family metal-dependent hydrolase
VFDRPRLLWAELLVADDKPVAVASVHAAAPDSLLPPPYNPIRRNRQLAAIAAFAESLCTDGRRLVVGGDFNTIRYAIPGMVDAALVAGDGRPTWRGLPVGWLPPLLRLDRLFLGPGWRVLDARVAVEYAGSDHCPVLATVASDPR